MATVLTHAAVPLLLGRAWGPGAAPRKLAVASIVLGLWPDADYLGLLFDIRPEALLGHRGLSHSAFVAAIAALLVTVLFFPRNRRGFWVLAASALSHPLLDMLTRGELGVALFAPLSDARLLFPFRPLHAIPLGVDEAFSRWSAVVVLGELLAVVAPLWVLVSAIEARRAQRPSRGVAVVASVWALGVLGVLLLAPSVFAHRVTPALARVDLDEIPTADLPDNALVTRFDALGQLGLLNRALEPARVPWSSTFFPAWYGAEGGRWHDAKPTLVSRTLFGFDGPFEPLSPAEKYDAVLGDGNWSATRAALTHGHNGKPRFWFGLCNGVAVAAMNFDEPWRTVDAVGVNGKTVRFHPQDIKALLAASNYWTQALEENGERCNEVRLDSGAACSMNPASLVIAATNRLGLAHSSFLIDVHPTPQNQYYPVASATVTVTRAPYPPTENTLSAAQLVDVELSFKLSSTTLGFAPGDQASADPTRFAKVGLREVPFTWNATLALGPQTEILGGRWNGDPPIGPDSIAFLIGGPLLTDGGMVEFNPGLRWSVVEALAKASTDATSPAPTVDVGAILDGGT